MKVYKQYNNSSYNNVQIQLPTPTLVGYESLDKSQYPDQTPKIKEIWHKVNSPDTDPFDKVGLMSESYIDGLLARFDLALHADEEDIKLYPLKERIKVYTTRNELLQLFSMEELESSEEVELKGEFIFTSVNMYDFPELELIKYDSDSIAWAIVSIFGNKKSIQFEKEAYVWKVNPLIESSEFYESRSQLVAQRIKSFGSESEYLKQLFGNDKRIFTPPKKK